MSMPDHGEYDEQKSKKHKIIKQSKVMLLNRIRELEKEIEAIFKFNELPVCYLTERKALHVIHQPGFINVTCYPRRYCLYVGEIGIYNKHRQVVR
jgi:hypothetical protein